MSKLTLQDRHANEQLCSRSPGSVSNLNRGVRDFEAKIRL